MLEIVVFLLMVALAAGATLHGGPHGLAASGGVGIVVAIVLGVTMLSAGQPSLLSWSLAAALAGLSAMAALGGVISVRKLPPRSVGGSQARLWGADGTAVTDLAPVGTISVLGETWSAESLSGPVRAGSVVHVAEVDGLRLRVWSDEPAGSGDRGEGSQ